MKKMKMRVFRMITCLTLVVSMAVIGALPTYAAGTETWSQNPGPVESMRVVNNNLTPVKTMGRSGKLYIYFTVQPCKQGCCSCSDCEPSTYSPVKVTMQIRRAGTTRVLASGYKGEGVFYTRIGVDVTQGEKIQLFCDVSSNGASPGVNRRGHVSYYYGFE